LNLNATVAPSTLTPTITPSDYQFTQKMSPEYTLYWQIDTTTQTIEFAVNCECTGWIAFGPSAAGIMLQSDIVLGTVSPAGVVSIDDYYNTARQAGCPGVCPDTQQGGVDNIIDFNGNVNNGVTQLKWIRPLKTTDKFDIDIVPGTMNAVWGYHPTSQVIIQHLDSTRSPIKINFFTGGVTTVIDLRVVHGLMMFFIWGVTIPATSFIARYLKRFSWWFNVHRISNGIAMLALVAAFVIAIFIATSQFTLPHHIIGLIIFIIGVFQPFIGITADKLFDPKREKTPIFPDKVHWILGWGSLTLGFINIVLGLILYGNAPLVTAFAVYFAVVGAFLLGYFVYHLIFGQPAKHM